MCASDISRKLSVHNSQRETLVAGQYLCHIKARVSNGNNYSPSKGEILFWTCLSVIGTLPAGQYRKPFSQAVGRRFESESQQQFIASLVQWSARPPDNPRITSLSPCRGRLCIAFFAHFGVCRQIQPCS